MCLGNPNICTRSNFEKKWNKRFEFYWLEHIPTNKILFGEKINKLLKLMPGPNFWKFSNFDYVYSRPLQPSVCSGLLKCTKKFLLEVILSNPQLVVLVFQKIKTYLASFENIHALSSICLCDIIVRSDQLHRSFSLDQFYIIIASTTSDSKARWEYYRWRSCFVRLRYPPVNFFLTIITEIHSNDCLLLSHSCLRVSR